MTNIRLTMISYSWLRRVMVSLAILLLLSIVVVRRRPKL
jgi:hypothetical protein